jgi:hypothetical protein
MKKKFKSDDENKLLKTELTMSDKVLKIHDTTIIEEYFKSPNFCYTEYTYVIKNKAKGIILGSDWLEFKRGGYFDASWTDKPQKKESSKVEELNIVYVPPEHVAGLECLDLLERSPLEYNSHPQCKSRNENVRKLYSTVRDSIIRVTYKIERSYPSVFCDIARDRDALIERLGLPTDPDDDENDDVEDEDEE